MKRAAVLARPRARGRPRARADAAGAAENRAAVHAVHAAQRPARDPARGSQRADGHREHVVPRRLRARAARAHRVRAPVRAPDVHGLGPREARRVRRVARGGRRRQQRLDRERSHQLLDQRAVQRARARAVPRVRSHGLPARLDDAEDRRRAARRRQERAAPELREPPVRHGRASRSARCSIPRAIRITGRSSATCRTSPPRATTMWWRSSRSTTRRRTPAWSSPAISRPATARTLVEKWFGDVKPARAAEPMTIPGVALTGVQKKTITDQRAAAAAVSRVADAAALRAGRRGARRRRRRPRRRQELAAVQAARLRHADRAGRQRLPGVAGAVLVVPDRRDAAARAHGRRAAEGDRRGDRRSCSARRRPRTSCERSVNQIEASFYNRMERVGGFGGKADQLNALLHRHRRSRLVQRGSGALPRAVGRPTSAPRRRSSCRSDRRVELIGANRRSSRRSVDADNDSCSADRRLCSACSCSVVAVLRVASRSSAQQAPDRIASAAAGTAGGAATCRRFRSSKLSNGLPVWIVEMHEVPVAQVNLVVFSGTADDPPGKFGVASLTAAMLEEGAGIAIGARDRRRGRLSRRRSRRRQRASTRRRCGCTCRWRGSPTRCRSWPTSRCGRRSRKTSSNASAQQRLTSLLQARDDPPTIASLAFSRVLYGKGASLRHAADGHGRDDQGASPPTICARFYTGAFRPENAVLLVVGDVTADKAMPLLEKSFGGWKASGAGGAGEAAADRRAAGARRSTWSTSRARRSRRSASAGSACRARRPTTFRSR